jgi:hypothetical protein
LVSHINTNPTTTTQSLTDGDYYLSLKNVKNLPFMKINSSFTMRNTYNMVARSMKD